MSYLALARKWRPRSFDEVVGQEHVVSVLASALDNDRVHHAFLFTGTRGVGKTTLARLLAKAVNCERGVSSSPCGTCTACQGVDEGRFLDLLEVDAASRTRVDDTREILDNVQYTPTQGRCKIYLIDEVHMLSGHSFNALLKTLEEPPGHVKFLLATTDPQKLPATILSRCLQLNLRVLHPDQITGQLEKILKAENIAYDVAGLGVLARAASGSMRDALSLLDQGIAFGGGGITVDEMRDMLGMIETRFVEEILRGLAAGDGPAVLEVCNRMSSRALDYMTALDDLLLVLHDISLYQTMPTALAAKGGDTGLVADLAGLMSPEDIQLYYQIGLISKRDLPLAPSPATGFEMALLRMLAFRPDSPEKPSGAPVDRTDNPKGSRPKTTSAAALQHHDAVDLKATASPLEARDLSQPEVWADLVMGSGLSGITRELAMNLSPCRFSGQTLEVSLVDSLGHLFSPSRLEVIEKNIAEGLGRTLRLKRVEAVPGDNSETPVISEKRRAEDARLEAYQNLINDPAVQDIMNVFDATVVPDSVRPGNHKGREQ
jgi:DNA polymerase-3 subunit gamma/tau|tara:strand:- start:1508 stop:3145 length:1638 start_codon:yes stop_codon:yes gene_type:complete